MTSTYMIASQDRLSQQDQLLAESWAVASVVNEICEKVVDQETRHLPWPDGPDPFIEAEMNERDIELTVSSIVDCIANHPVTGDGSGEATVSYVDGFFKHDIHTCQCELCETTRVYESSRPPSTPLSERIPPAIGRTSSGVSEEELSSRTSNRGNVSRQLFIEDREGWTSQHQPARPWIVSSQHEEIMREMGHERRDDGCELCEHSAQEIHDRFTHQAIWIERDTCMWRCCGSEDDVEPEYVCTSCTYDGNACYKCGLSEELYKANKQTEWRSLVGSEFEDTDRWSFYPDTSENPPTQRFGVAERPALYCPACALHEGHIDEETFEETLIEYEDDEDEEEYQEFAGTYTGEYENEDPPENNSEKMKAVKDVVKDMGELIFDIQDKVPEGDYLKMMDHLQKITNIANS